MGLGYDMSNTVQELAEVLDSFLRQSCSTSTRVTSALEVKRHALYKSTFCVLGFTKVQFI